MARKSLSCSGDTSKEEEVRLLGGGEARGEGGEDLGQGALGDVARRRHAHLEAAREHDGERRLGIVQLVRAGIEAKHAARPALQRREAELVEPILAVVGEHVDVHAAQVREVADDDDAQEEVGEEGLELLRPVPAAARPRRAGERGGLGEGGREGVARAGQL